MNHELARRLAYAVFLADESSYLSKSKNIHFSYTETCLMYILDDERQYSQKEISDALMIPPSTINTVIKKWEKEGLITQLSVEGSRHEKKLIPTEQGREYFRTGLSFIYAAEEIAIQKTVEAYSDQFIEALEYYGKCLKNAFEEMDGSHEKLD